MVSEAWLNQITSEAKRGKTIAIYVRLAGTHRLKVQSLRRLSNSVFIFAGW
ncbi:MFS transporter [Mesorhizobium sp. CGMCC 1.15528]|uniref:MFS transporter n=1 Tax=Mesorhizobium zhangyense TaxID=1776730 RepID=A0A7C9VFP7_9HYPH|nr:MFS transporter [Mesorhizobium zhangyense]NGN43630.1 MFS transporter [Mesorhizobium zhangyense]